jgi:hypothetical protein
MISAGINEITLSQMIKCSKFEIRLTRRRT